MNPVDVVVIGHFAKDKLVVRGEESIASGGSVYYGAVALRRLGLRVAVVTRLHPDDFPRLDALRELGIAVFAQPASQTSGIENIYISADMDRRITHPLGFAGPIRSEDVPDIVPRLYLVGPIMVGEVDLPFVQVLAQHAPVALDAQGFVRVRAGNDLVFQDWLDKRDGLPLVRYLKVDSAEAEVLTGLTDPPQAARALAAWGAHEIVLTHATGVLVHADGQDYHAPWTARSLQGRTGRGDTCFAAYLAKRITTGPEDACHFAAEVTSRKMEVPGALRSSWASIDDGRE